MKSCAILVIGLVKTRLENWLRVRRIMALRKIWSFQATWVEMQISQIFGSRCESDETHLSKNCENKVEKRGVKANKACGNKRVEIAPLDSRDSNSSGQVTVVTNRDGGNRFVVPPPGFSHRSWN